MGNVTGGYVTAANATGVSLDQFTSFAHEVNRQGLKNDLIKFGTMHGGEGVADRIVLRTPSRKLDSLFACDIKNPFFRTDDTKRVNRNVVETFVNALKEEYGDINLKDRPEVFEEMHFEDFIDKSKLEAKKKGPEPFKLSNLVELIEESGNGTPLSARQIINISNEMKKVRWTEKDQQTYCDEFKNVWEACLDGNNEVWENDFNAFQDKVLAKYPSKSWYKTEIEGVLGKIKKKMEGYHSGTLPSFNGSFSAALQQEIKKVFSDRASEIETLVRDTEIEKRKQDLQRLKLEVLNDPLLTIIRDSVPKTVKANV